ncbi:MAG: hypothetical protein RJB66_1059 [Pseudomonadota bacterium]|jgi:TolA-binding protein
MRQGMIALIALSLGGLLGCQSFSNRADTNTSMIKNEIRSKKTFPHLKVPGGPSNILKEHGEFGVRIPEDATSPVGPIELTDKEKLFFELAGEKVEGLSELQVYQRAVERSKQSDSAALNAYSSLLLKRFPNSIYCDNVIYLQGMLAFNQKNYGPSLNLFQKIIDRYPQSNKAVSALFAKGIVFRKMNLEKEAVKVLAQVMNKYPGSPESERAQVELKLITQ